MSEQLDCSPRKRPRLDSDASDSNPTAVSPVHDEQYYKEGGDCVIQVEDVLFRIHKERLAHDASAFEDMFGFPPSDTNAAQCSSDDNPLVCHDTATQFRALCWALYAVPTEIIAQMKKGASLARLVELAFIANKYGFSSYEEWALDALHANISCPNDVHNCSPDLLVRLVDISAICDHKKLLDTVLPGWIDSAKKGRVAWDPILEACERHNLRSWQCDIYMYNAKRLMRKNIQNASANNSTNMVAPLSFENIGLKGIHLHRVLAGYASLSMISARVRMGIPTLDRSPRCDPRWHQTKCSVMWKYFWDETTRNQSSLNLVGDLEVTILDTFHSIWGSGSRDGVGTVNPECHSLGAGIVKKLRDDIKASLPQYFFGADI